MESLLENRGGLDEEVGRAGMAQEQQSPQHNRRSIAHYLPFVDYNLVGISFDIGTRNSAQKRKIQKPHPL